jgi:exonuclease SbcD
VLVAHQNVTASGAEVERGGSESMIGGVGQVDYTVFDDFDYVALGHIHAGYPVGRQEVRYAGSPLCYHFNEVRQPVKGPLLVTLGEKGAPVEAAVQVIPPLHPLKPWTGSRDAVTALAQAVEPGAYVSITLTDQRITPEISESLRGLLERRGCTLLELNSAFREQEGADAGLTTRAVQERSLPELFSDFYRAKEDGTELSEGEQSLLEYAAELLGGAGDEARDEALAARLLARAKEDEA